MPATEHDHHFRLFGTDVRVLVSSPTPLDALRVHALFQRLHRTLTRFDPASELSCLNARSGQEVAVSPALLRAVEAAVWAAGMSDGLVDPTILDDLEHAGYAGSRDGQAPVPLTEALHAAAARRPAAPRRPARWASITLDASRSTIRLPAGIRIDLGGSAKGLAADLAGELLAGHSGYAVDAGGDLRIGGSEPGPRAVHIRHPLDDEIAHSFTVTTGAVATSGLQTRVWRTERGFAHHLIDPARGTPAWTGVIQATALAATALEAETLAKTALLRGPRAGRDVLARHGGALILDDGSLVLAGDLAATPNRVAA
jgi:FAD:protein FMN transferase